MAITVCHMRPGTRKWNKIEHRLFSHSSMNWRGRPLTSHDVIVNSIVATTTRTGLTVHAELDPGTYDTGIKVTNRRWTTTCRRLVRANRTADPTMPGVCPALPEVGVGRRARREGVRQRVRVLDG
ncbi:hypothetical protein GCM10010271_57600 [Streptomyces kurssanovii]|nr:hypothetical protein GCM10010271_57600 [Streptomyces kurssanovii]